MKNQKGFSLIELLIVVVIIGIIAAIAIPNLLASRRSANEGSAISNLRTIHGGEMTYKATKGAGRYGHLTELRDEGIVDSVLGASDLNSPKSGYNYSVFPGGIMTSIEEFDVQAVPQQSSGISATGTRSFYINETGVIYWKAGTDVPTRLVNGVDGTVLNN